MSTAQQEQPSRGAQPGNLNAMKGKRFAEVLLRIGLENDGKRLRAVGEKLWKLAEGGDMQAIKEVMDRVDGRVPAGVELTGANGGDLVVRDVGTAIGTARRVAFAMSFGALKLIEGGKKADASEAGKETKA